MSPKKPRVSRYCSGNPTKTSRGGACLPSLVANALNFLVKTMKPRPILFL